MSYCRFGEESDVYLYKSCHKGYVLQVARRRRDTKGEPYPKLDWENLKDSYDKRIEFYKKYPDFVEIGLPYDGDSYSLGAPECMWDVLLDLKVVGYKVPDDVFELLQEDIDNGEH